MYDISKTTDFESVIRECYNSDSELIEKYHIMAPTTLDKAVDKTVEDFKGAATFSMYRIDKNGKLLAYFGREKTKLVTLTGFFIMPEFRTKEFVTDFWRIVRSKMPSTFYCAVFTKNERAIKFLKKKNFKQFVSLPSVNLYKFN